MPLNHYVTLGRSGLRVSPFCLGAMTFGEDLGWGSSVTDSNRIMDRYTERGGNFIDTANSYTRGHSEKIIGDHIGRDSRKRLVLATKFFANLHLGDPNGGGANCKTIHAQLHESLRRLQTDYVDLYWMHAWDRFTPIDETMRVLDDLVSAGKVRYIGFSDTPAWKVVQARVAAQLRGWTPLAALQIEYSLLERTVEGELMPMATGAESGSDPVVAPGAKELGTTTARIALAWVKDRPGVARPSSVPAQLRSSTTTSTRSTCGSRPRRLRGSTR
jgi:aryl-alcohol dehydrogenase-like predicted oxidoreductase